MNAFFNLNKFRVRFLIGNIIFNQVFISKENGDYFIKLISSYNSEPISTKLYKYGREQMGFDVSKFKNDKLDRSQYGQAIKLEF